MKLRIATLSLLTILCLALGTTALAQQVYNDGPINGTVQAFFIDGPGGPFGQSISDGFFPTLTWNGPVTVTFGEWVATGAIPTGVFYGIGNQNFGGALLPGGSFSIIPLCTNGNPYGGSGGLCGGGFGYDVYESSFTTSGSYTFIVGTESWLTLTVATATLNGAPNGFNAWDENNGPATCTFEVGTIVPGGGIGCDPGGESFTISAGGPPPSTPEPSSILLLGSGVLGLAGVLRRKLNIHL
jgi:hypothetical protein